MAQASSYRFDIQFLRGVAVLLVVAYHAGAGSGGFLGVDVFFVISGFLVTGIVLRALAERSFTFGGFYLRRARRLLPAAFSTFAMTTLLASVLLTRDQWALYLGQLAGALTFTANIVLWFQSDYFAPAAETKPLLHIWSLSLEEQFYFLMPAALWLFSARWRPALIFAGLVASAALCFVFAGSDGGFYLLPTRAWELLAGAACAWALMRWPSLRLPGFVPWLALAVILLVSIIGADPVHPRGDALLVVAATALIILGGDGWLTKQLASNVIARIGDWSYSLYLIHWPLLSFGFIVFLGDPPLWLTFGIAALSFPLAWLQFRYVETPFRTGIPRRVFWPAVTAALGATAAPALAAHTEQAPAFVLGLAPECRQQGAWHDAAACRTSPHPTVAVWGDSNAMQLVPPLRSLRMIQLTKSACPPVLDRAATGGRYDAAWARGCVAFNRSAFDHITADPGIRHVILGGAFHAVVGENGTGRAALVRTIAGLQAAGKSVVIVAPIPRPSFDPQACLARVRDGVPIVREDCSFTTAELDPDFVFTRQALREVAREAGVVLFEPETVICASGRCRAVIGGRSIYRDAFHLSRGGSDVVVRRMGLSDSLR